MAVMTRAGLRSANGIRQRAALPARGRASRKQNGRSWQVARVGLGENDADAAPAPDNEVEEKKEQWDQGEALDYVVNNLTDGGEAGNLVAFETMDAAATVQTGPGARHPELEEGMQAEVLPLPELPVLEEVPAEPERVELIKVSQPPVHETTISELIAFTLPTMAIWLASPVLSLVDATVVGAHSVTELAALTPGTVVVDYVAYVFSFLGIATTTTVSVTVARKDREGTQTLVNDALSLALLCGVVLGAGILALSNPLFSAMLDAQSKALVGPAGVYANIRAIGIPFALLGMVLQCAFLASKNTRVPFMSTAVGGVANLIGDLVMVNVLGLGIAGAAWATVLSQVLSLGVLAYHVGRVGIGGMPFAFSPKLPKLSSLVKFVRIAGPVCLILLSKVVVFCTVSFSAANIGPIASAAHALMFNIFLFFCVPGDALNQCAQTFLPPVAGHKRLQQRIKAKLLATGAVIGLGNFVLGGLLLGFAPHLLSPSLAVQQLIRSGALLAASVLFLHPFGISTEGILMATRKFGFLVSSYALNMVAMLALVHMCIVSQGATLTKVWLSLLGMQTLRLSANFSCIFYNFLQAKRKSRIEGKLTTKLA